MKTPLIALGLAIATLAPAGAQPASSFSTGRVSVQFSGWSRAASQPNSEVPHLLDIERVGQENGQTFQHCSLESAPIAGPAADQSAINQRMQGFGEANAREALGDAAVVDAVRHNMVDGVLVIDIDAHGDGEGPTRLRDRMAFLAAPAGTMYYRLECLAFGRETDAAGANMDAVLNSLHFTTTSPP